MYTTKVYKAVGGDAVVVASGGKIIIQPGGEIEMEGEIVQSITFDGDYFEVNDGEVTLKTDVSDQIAVIAAIPTVDPADDGITIWNDGGVLKVSGASGD